MNWSKNLNAQQRETVKEIIRLQRKYSDYVRGPDGMEGLTVFSEPTTLPAKVVEVRRRFRDGFFRYWRVEPDGSISAEGLKSISPENLIRANQKEEGRRPQLRSQSTSKGRSSSTSTPRTLSPERP